MLHKKLLSLRRERGEEVLGTEERVAVLMQSCVLMRRLHAWWGTSIGDEHDDDEVFVDQLLLDRFGSVAIPP
jgi:hypothetical protein